MSSSMSRDAFRSSMGSTLDTNVAHRSERHPQFDEVHFPHLVLSLVLHSTHRSLYTSTDQHHHQTAVEHCGDSTEKSRNRADLSHLLVVGKAVTVIVERVLVPMYWRAEAALSNRRTVSLGVVAPCWSWVALSNCGAQIQWRGDSAGCRPSGMVQVKFLKKVERRSVHQWRARRDKVIGFDVHQELVWLTLLWCV